MLKTKLPTDTWVRATWDEYIQEIADPAYQKAKCYYHNIKWRIEMSPPDDKGEKRLLYED